MRERFEQLAARIGAGRRGPAPLLEDGYWASLRELFTRGVTQDEVQRLLAFEARDALRYFSRDLDTASLARHPWWKRYPLLAWAVFQAMAYRLSPARRVLFATGALFLAGGWLAFLVGALGDGPGPRLLGLPLPGAVLAAATLLFALLALELRDKLALKGDLEIARQIQFGLLPFEPYASHGVAIQAAMRPANTVGGDYFDVIDLGPGRLGLVVGDVSGKGMPAALLMALLQASLQTLVSAGFRGDELVAKLNAHLCAHIPSNRLITLFYGELTPGDSTLRYVNAGHNAPFLLRREGPLERLAATNVALGVLPEECFVLMETPFASGDRLVLFTDGVSEAFDSSDQEYGEARIEAFLRARRRLPRAELVDALIADVLAFCGNARPHDDMTLLVADREA